MEIEPDTVIAGKRKVLEFKPRSDLTMGEFAQILTALTIVLDERLTQRLDKKLLRHFEEKEVEVGQ
jgi:hypothetical protein